MDTLVFLAALIACVGGCFGFGAALHAAVRPHRPSDPSTYFAASPEVAQPSSRLQNV